jgi:hypothetical protein
MTIPILSSRICPEKIGTTQGISMKGFNTGKCIKIVGRVRDSKVKERCLELQEFQEMTTDDLSFPQHERDNLQKGTQR